MIGTPQAVRRCQKGEIMKRYLAQIGLTFFSVLAAAFYLPDQITQILLISCATPALLFFLIRKTRKMIFLPLIATAAALACAVNLLYTAWTVKPVTERFTGKAKQIEATLTDESYRQYGKYCYPLETDSINGEEVHVKILLKMGRPMDIKLFDKVKFTCDIVPTVKQYDLAKNYYITADTKGVNYTVSETDNLPLGYHIINLRKAIRKAIASLLPMDEANLAKAILIGDKYALDQSVKADFRYSGASHFIVVSGMHFSILIMLCMWAFEKLFRKRYIYFPLIYLVILLYMAVTGFQPSVMRSGVMMIVMVTGKWIRRQIDPLTSLGVAGVVLPIIFSPYGCGDIGMILSFSATFSIIVWQKPIYERLRVKKVVKRRFSRWLMKGINAVIGIISTCLAANILVLPLSVFLFNSFSPMTLLSALLLYPLIWIILAAALIVSLFFYLGPLRVVAVLFSWPLYGAAKLTLWLVNTISSFPFAYVHVRSLYVYLWIAVTLGMFFIAYLLRKRRRLYPAVVLFSAILFLSGMIVTTIVRLNTVKLEFYAGKSGSAIILNHQGRAHVLRFDCDSYTAYDTLNYLADHFGGAESEIASRNGELTNYNRLSAMECPVKHALVYDGIDRPYESETDEIIFTGDSTIALDDGVILKTVEDNDRLLLYLTDGDKSILILPDSYPVDKIPDDMKSPDILFVGKTGKNYDRLSCHSLFIYRVRDDSEKVPLPKYKEYYDLKNKHVVLDLKQH